MLGSLCVAEEGVGSDPASVVSTAVKSEDEDFYILNGTKTWVAGGADAGLFTVFAKYVTALSSFLTLAFQAEDEELPWRR